MKNNLLDLTFQKEIDCVPEVAWWNYWDHEHLDVVHSNYKKSDILYDKDNFLFRIDEIKIPLVPFISAKTPIFMVQHNSENMYCYAVQFGVISKTTITIKKIGIKKSLIKMNYKFYLNGWRILLKPLLKKMIPIWNERVWLEDLPIKLRRQKVLDLNFKDFRGLPLNIKDRNFEGPIKLRLPIPRPRKSTRDIHPLSEKL
tara:strand:- start:175 stop:774 length:600 start_codon:yes stop_codon:yes gene_type:complete